MPLSLIRHLSRLILNTWKHWVGPKLVPLLSTIELIGLAIAGLGLWGFAHIADEVLESETQVIDASILLALHQIQTPWLDQWMLGVTALGQPTFLVIVTLSISTVLLLRRQLPEAVILAIAALGATGLNTLLKEAFARARPELWQRVIDVRYYSFPSGHAMVSLVIYGLIGYLLATHFKLQSGWILGLTALVIVTIGFSRLYLGVHWPTDIVAGYAAGTVWLVTCILTLEVWRRKSLQISAQ